ncbi:MAG: sigma-70 family RNA polymerase sigma factor, partial [Planctomycetes bacterium]|nr:sigma-70 family RNA polymerase sigma factor [Planctomycetota bacterium]
MTESNPIDASTLLAETHFLRQLATRLVGPDDADDVAQDVLIAATSATAPDDVDRRWLGGVTRKIAAFRQRGESRRRRREALVARADEVASAADLVQRAEMQRMLADAVNALPAGLRDVVVLRFYEDLPPRDVAKRLGIPVNTVRSRTRRALEQLRTELDSKHGDRRAWVTALAPLVLPQTAALFSMTHAIRWTAAALVLVALSVGGWFAFDARPPALPSFERHGEVTSIFADSATESEPGTVRVEVPTGVTTPPGISGRVVDTDGDPVRDATVYLGSLGWYRAMKQHEPAKARARDARTDRDGRFMLPEPASVGLSFHSGLVELGEPLHDEYVAVEAETRWDVDAEPVIVMQRLLPVRLEVEVVDETGAPVSMFRVSAWNSWSSESDPNGYRSRMALREVRGTDGSFSADIRAVEGIPLRVSVDCPGHGNSTFGPRASIESHVLRQDFEVVRDAVLRVRFDVDLQLAERIAERTTSGRVIDAETKRPIPGVELLMRTDGWFETPKPVCRNQTRADGSFRIARPSDRISGKLRAEHPEYDPVELTADRDEIGDILLTRRGSFGCTVVDGDGTPIPGMPFLFRTLDGKVHERGRTDASGRIAFPGLVSARYWVYLLTDPM